MSATSSTASCSCCFCSCCCCFCIKRGGYSSESSATGSTSIKFTPIYPVLSRPLSLSLVQLLLNFLCQACVGLSGSLSVFPHFARLAASTWRPLLISVAMLAPSCVSLSLSLPVQSKASPHFNTPSVRPAGAVCKLVQTDTLTDTRGLRLAANLNWLCLRM